MPIIGEVKLCTDKPVSDTTAPNDVKVNRAEWGDVQQSMTSSRAVDPLLIDAEGLQAGMSLLFINVDDPKIRALVAAGNFAALPAAAVKAYDLKDVDLGKKQTLVFSDKQGLALGLTRGCEFALLQKDKAGNLSKSAAFVELKNDGTALDNFQMNSADALLGDAQISLPAYSYRDPHGYNRSSSTYRFVRGPDTTAATTYAQDIKLALDTATGKVTMSGDKAVTGKSTIILKNIHTQQEYRVKADDAGSFNLPDLALQPGARFKVWTVDRNNVQELVMDRTFDPKVCAHGCGGQASQGGTGQSDEASQGAAPRAA